MYPIVAVRALVTHCGFVRGAAQLFKPAEFAIRVGPHAYNQSYAELTLTWFAGGGINITISATVDNLDSSQLTLLATVNQPSASNKIDPKVDESDYLLVVAANFTHGRAGRVTRTADGKGVTAEGAGLRARTVTVISGDPTRPSNESAIPAQTAYVFIATRVLIGVLWFKSGASQNCFGSF